MLLIKYIKKYWIIIICVFFFSSFINPAISFFILGFLMFYFGIVGFIFIKKIHKNGIETTGRILSYQAGRGGYKIPIIEFKPIDGDVVTEKPFVYASTDLSKIRSYKKMIDAEVKILYDPGNPKKFVLIDEKEFNYIASIAVALGGLVFVVFSVCVLFGYIKLQGR